MNPAVNGNMSRVSVSTRTSYLMSISVSFALVPPPTFAEVVCESQRGQHLRLQAHRWHISLIDTDDMSDHGLDDMGMISTHVSFDFRAAIERNSSV